MKKYAPEVPNLLGCLCGSAYPSQLNYSKSRTLRVTSLELQELENDEKSCRTLRKITKIEILRLTKNEPENAAEHQK